MITASFCGNKNATECFSGIQRINVFIEALKSFYNIEIKPYLELNYPNKYKIAIDEMAEIGKRLYGKSRGEITAEMNKIVAEQQTNGLTLQVLTLTKISSLLSNIGIKSLKNYTVFDGLVDQYTNFEDVNPLDKLEARFAKYKFVGSVGLGSTKGAFYVPTDFPFIMIYPNVASVEQGMMGLRGTEKTAYEWEIGIPVITAVNPFNPGGNGNNNGGGGNSEIITNPNTDCPCKDITKDKQVYLSRTKMSNNDVPFDMTFKKQICTTETGQKKITIDCEEEVAKIIKAWSN